MLALVLASIGIYGVVSFVVANRMREFGIRMALGATTGDVQIMLLREERAAGGDGRRGGGVCVPALVKARAIVETMLFLVSSRDAATFVLVPSLLTLVAVLACWFPAQRATRVDPTVALRDE